MKTMAAAEANRHFSSVLRDVSHGEQILVVTRGKPIAKIVPVDTATPERARARAILMARLQEQAPSGERNWTRAELYDQAHADSS